MTNKDEKMKNTYFVARDLNGSLYMHAQRPALNYDMTEYMSLDFVKIDDNLFPELTFNDGPKEVYMDKEAYIDMKLK